MVCNRRSAGAYDLGRDDWVLGFIAEMTLSAMLGYGLSSAQAKPIGLVNNLSA